MTAIGPIREDTRRLLVTVFHPGTDTPIIRGVWDTKTGGQVDSEETIYHPGEMADPISLGGRKNVENLTLTRLCRLGRDWDALPALIAAVGKAKVTMSDQPLDFDGNTAAGHRALTYNGTLKRVQPPPANSESSGAAMLEIEVTVTGYPS